VFPKGDRSKYLAQFKEGFSLPLEVVVPGVLRRKVELLVKPTYQTYVEISH
jgi:hypothetical protein